MKTRRMDLSLDHYDALREKNDALRAENAKLREALTDLVAGILNYGSYSMRSSVQPAIDKARKALDETF